MSPFQFHFNGAKDDRGGGDNWSYKMCKAPVKSSSAANQHPIFFTGQMPFRSPNQQCQSTKGKYTAVELINSDFRAVVIMQQISQ